MLLYTGAVINAILIGLVEVARLRVHLIMASLIAAYVGIVIFTIASFDHIYMGQVSVDSTYFQQLRTNLFGLE